MLFTVIIKLKGKETVFPKNFLRHHQQRFSYLPGRPPGQKTGLSVGQRHPGQKRPGHAADESAAGIFCGGKGLLADAVDSEKLDLILTKLLGMEHDIHGMKDDIGNLKSDIARMKGHITEIRDDILTLMKNTSFIEIHLETSTDRNIRLLAENFIDLTNKLNQATPAANKNLAYEVKVTYAIEEVKKLAEKVAKIMERSA